MPPCRGPARAWPSAITTIAATAAFKPGVATGFSRGHRTWKVMVAQFDT